MDEVLTAFESSSTPQALRRVSNTLEYSLKEEYGISDPEITEKFLKMHGLSKEHFDFINNFEKLLEKGIADHSIDTNANKSEKSIAGYLVETTMPINKIVGYRYLYRKMKDMYGKREAKRLSGLMYNMALAIADSTNILKPYCFAINAQRLVLEGKPWGTPSEVPHRVGSYIGMLSEVLHQLSTSTAGALAIGSFFFDIAHLVIFGEKKTLSQLKHTKFRKSIKQAIQSFVHSANSLSRNGLESPFSNLSIQDSSKIQAFLADDNMGWYYEWSEAPTNVQEDCGSEENWKNYVQDMVLELQEIYMEIMDAGVTAEGGHPFEFPVSTVNFSRVPNGDGTFRVEDEEAVNRFCEKHDIVRYNIYSSEGMKVASCCRLVNDFDLFSLGGQVNSFGGSGLSLGSHRVVTINMNRIALECTSPESYMEILEKRMNDASKILLAHRALLQDLTNNGHQPFISNDWLDLKKMFSTFGLIGYYEANKNLQRFGEKDYLPEILKFINDKALEMTLEQKNPYNIEQIPGESMCSKCANTDRWIFGEDKVPEAIYSNQFLPNYGPEAHKTIR